MSGSKIAVFKGKKIRKTLHNEEWYFSIIDVVEVLTESANPRRYWSDLKKNLIDDEGFSQLYDKIVQLKMQSSDGKKYLTDTASTETLLRVIQSIPSPKAEPLKRWLANFLNPVPGKQLKELKNVGKATLKDLEILGIRDVEELAEQDPRALYERLEELTGSRHDPCVLDVFAAIVHEAKTGEATAWWEWTPKRKKNAF